MIPMLAVFYLVYWNPMSRRRIEGWKTRYGTSHTTVYSISSFILRRRRCRPLTSVGFQPYHVDCNKYNTIESDADGLGIAGGRTIGRGEEDM